MERKEGQNGPLLEDACRELGRCEAGSALFHKELDAYKKMFNEDEDVDESYKILLVSLFMKENQFIVPQKAKRDDKLEPLLPILRYKRSEQLLKRGQYLREHGSVRENASKDRLTKHADDVQENTVKAFRERCKPCNKKQNGKGPLIREDDDDVREDAGAVLKEDVFCENAGTGLKEGFEMPKKRKGNGLLIHYDDVNVHEVVGEGYKKQNGKDHLIEPQDVREDSEKTIFEPHKRDSKHCLISEKDDVHEKAYELEKKQKGKSLLIEHDDDDVGENGGEALKERLKRPNRYNAFCENGGKTSKIKSGMASKERFEPERERKGKDRVIEHDHKLRENVMKTLKDRLKSREMQNGKAAEERSEPPFIKPKDNNAKEIFLKLMNEYKQSKSEAIPKIKNVATIKTEEGIGSNKDNESEPIRELTRIVKPVVELLNQVPNPVKRPDAKKSRNDKKSKADIEKRSAHRSNDEDEVANVEIEKRPTRRSRKIIYEDYSSDEDRDVDGRQEIENCPSREFGNFVRKKSKNESREADIEKRSSRRSRRVVCKEYSSDEDEDVVKKKCPTCRSRKAILEESGGEYDREEIDKCSSWEVRNISMKKPKSRKVRNVTMKKPKNENAKADIEKCSYHQSRKVIYNESLSREDEDVGIEKLPARRLRKAILEELSDKDDREVIVKRLSREVMKKPKNKNTEADIEKHTSRQSRKVIYKGYSSNEDDKVGIEKCSSRRSRKAVLEELGDEDESEKIKKRSSRKVRNVIMKNPKNEKAEIEKLSSHHPRKVVYEEYSSDEDEDEDEDENVDLRIKKCLARRSRKGVLKKFSDEDDDEDREIEKCSSRKVRNAVTNKPKDEKTDSEIDKYSSRRSKGVAYVELSDEDVRIEKFSFHGSRNVCSPSESSNETEMLYAKRAAREYREITMKRPRGEGVEEEIERSRDFLLKRSRYEIEGRAPRGLTNFRAGESSMRHKKIDEDSSEENKESSDGDSDVEILDGDECLNGPFVPSTRSKIIEENGFRLSEDYIKFRRQVLEVISKPYDKGEYKALLKEFHGRCYPGYHQDVVKKLKRNRWNPRKRLAILRGFFFWIQNLTRKGSFKPWHDGICLKVEPERPPRNRGGNQYASGSIRG